MHIYTIMFEVINFVFKGAVVQMFYKMMHFSPENYYFVLANSAYSYEMPPLAAFHLGLHCLPKYLYTYWYPEGKGLPVNHCF